MSLLSNYLNQTTDQFIDVSMQVTSADSQDIENVIQAFSELVNDFVTILEHPSKPIIRVPFSGGKDSTCVLLIVLEAYSVFLKKNPLQKDRLLSIVNVNTKIESLPMVAYCEYVHEKIIQYCKNKGICLRYDVVSPSLSDEFFIKYGNADKLVSNASRGGECTNILKLENANKNKRLVDGVTGGQPLITCVGSRLAESIRRATNMSKQRISAGGNDELIEQLNTGHDVKNINFAPIKHWPDSFVFALLRIVGSDPIWRSEKFIDCFLPHMRLLVEIYGQGSGAEVCDIADTSSKNSCGGAARFGCTQCTQIVNDKSSAEISSLPRWRVLGSENALRVRDWLFRLSCSPESRMYHARAYDPVYCRVILQPNVLKTKYLLDMARYASQLTHDSIAAAKHLRDLISEGRELEHEGYADIVNDPNMHPKTKAQFLDLYRTQCTKPLLNYFSLKHAVMQSFLFSLNGVGALPYAPLKIWHEISSGAVSVAYPKLNSEMPYPVKLTTSPVPEARVLRVFTQDYENNGFKNDDFLSLAPSYQSIGAILGESNCASEQAIADFQHIQCQVNLVLNVNLNSPYFELQSAVKLMRFTHKESGRQIKKSQIIGLMQELKDKASEKIEMAAKHAPNAHLYNACRSAFNAKNEAHLKATLIELTAQLSENLKLNSVGLTLPIAHFKNQTFSSGVQLTGRKRYTTRQRTERKIIRNKGKITRTTTKLRFYTPHFSSALEKAHKVSSELLIPSLSTYAREQMAVFDINDEECVLDKIMFNEETFELAWYELDFLERALKKYDNARAYCQSMQMTEAAYNSSNVVTELLSAGGLMIHPDYLSHFEFRFRRLTTLHFLDAFRFQSMSEFEIDADPLIIPMTQHRHDKASYLKNVVKPQRSAGRQFARKQLSALSQDNYSSYAAHQVKHKIDMLFDIAVESVNQIVHYTTLPYPSEHITNAQRCKILRTWLHFYCAALTNENSLHSTLMSNVERQTISNDASALFALNNQFCALTSTLLDLLSQVVGNVHLAPRDRDTFNMLIQQLQRIPNPDEQKLLTTSKLDLGVKSSTLFALL